MPSTLHRQAIQKILERNNFWDKLGYFVMGSQRGQSALQVLCFVSGTLGPLSVMLELFRMKG